MKHIAKIILPQTAINKLRLAHAMISLSQIKKTTFTPSNLALVTAIDTTSIFSDSTIHQKWQEDDALITGMFPSRDILDGVNPGDRRALYYLTMALRPQRVLEVGTHIGASTLYIAKALSHIGINNQILTVDICDVNNKTNSAWKQAGLPKPPIEYIDQAGCGNLVKFVTGTSLEYLEKGKNYFDLIFLDGDHSAPTVYREIAASLKRLNPGGVIILHDYYPDGHSLYPDNNIIYGPYLAASRIKRENSNITFLPLGQLPWITKQNTSFTSLCLITKVSG